MFSIGVSSLRGGVPTSLEALWPLVAVIIGTDDGLVVTPAFAADVLMLTVRVGTFVKSLHAIGGWMVGSRGV